MECKQDDSCIMHCCSMKVQDLKLFFFVQNCFFEMVSSIQFAADSMFVCSHPVLCLHLLRFASWIFLNHMKYNNCLIESVMFLDVT